MFFLTLGALIISFLALMTLAWQTRLLRKTMEANNYQSLIEKIMETRQAVITHEPLGSMFDKNPQIHSVLQVTNMTIQQFFWTLQFLTAWENFYHQRRNGLLADATWKSYVH